MVNLSLRCSLKISFLSSLSSKCFWTCTFSITTLWKQTLGWENSCRVFLKKRLLQLVLLGVLFSLASNFIKVLVQYICCFKHIRNYWKQISIIGKQLKGTLMHLKISLYVRIHVKIVPWKFCILIPKNSRVLYP